MPYRGIVKGNVIIVDHADQLKEGTEVEVFPVNSSDNVDTICGTWDDERSAEDIIEDIRSSRYSRKRDVIL
jgi:hypothetical protein